MSNLKTQSIHPKFGLHMNARVGICSLVGVLLVSTPATAQPAISSAVFSAGGVVQANGDVLSLGQPFAGTASGGSFGIIPAITGAAGCPADFNGSGGTPTVQDIFDFLAAYFAQDPRADFNGVGGISVQDIFDFLAAYFTGCS